MKDVLAQIAASRSNYRAVRAALPWLDCWVSPLPGDRAQLAAARPEPETPFVVPAVAGSAGAAEARTILCVKGVPVPEGTAPLLVKSSEYSVEEIDAFAAAHAGRPVVIVTGCRKILYYIAPFRELLKKHADLYLSIANFCNELALERYAAEGLAGRLLYGSFLPFLEADASMGPLILSELDWKTKCDIAGNNFRKLLGEKAVYPAEVPFVRPARPFFVDAHAHTVRPETPKKFEEPAGADQWSAVRDYLALTGCGSIILIPSEANRYAEVSGYQYIKELMEKAAGRVAFMEDFDPRDVAVSLAHLEESLPLASCVGIKLHPATHKTMADDPRYREAFQMARRFHKPVMTHSWAVSDYNPAQKFACPELFERWFKEFPDVTFVLGHAGGRPESMAEVIRLCRTYPQVFVDVAGDYFNNGVTATLLRDISAGRVLFASDAYWIDQRCELGMLFASEASDAELGAIFFTNACKVYGFPARR